MRLAPADEFAKFRVPLILVHGGMPGIGRGSSCANFDAPQSFVVGRWLLLPITSGKVWNVELQARCFFGGHAMPVKQEFLTYPHVDWDKPFGEFGAAKARDSQGAAG